METTQADHASTDAPDQTASPKRLDGVVIGVLLGINKEGAPLVAYPGSPAETAIAARATTTLEEASLGREVALLFEGGDPRLPLVIGLIQWPEQKGLAKSPAVAELDEDRLVLTAEKEIVLKCGKASITLTRAGKVLIRGAYLLSRSAGVNRITGGVVHIN